MKTHPLKDKRYTVTREFTGHAKPQFVTRFCDEWITSRSTYPAAVIAAAGHKCRRDNALIVTEIKP